MRKTFADTMLEIGQQDPKLVVLLGDISHFIMQPFAKACPGRFYNVGICEPTIVSMAAGLSHSGFHPVAHTIAPFMIERSFEQIKLDFCYQGLGGTLISVGSAFDYSTHGCSHHCYDDFALLKTLPGTQIFYPAMPNEFRVLFGKTYTNESLTYFRLPTAKHGVEIPDHQLEIGKNVLIKPGTDVTIIAVGSQLKTVMDSIPDLTRLGVNAEVIYVHTIKPFDYESVAKSVSKTKRYLVIEEHSKYGGASDEVMRATLGCGDIRSAFINIPDNFMRNYGSYTEHCNALGMSVDGIVKTVQDLCK